MQVDVINITELTDGAGADNHFGHSRCCLVKADARSHSLVHGQ